MRFITLGGAQRCHGVRLIVFNIFHPSSPLEPLSNENPISSSFNFLLFKISNLDSQLLSCPRLAQLVGSEVVKIFLFLRQLIYSFLILDLGQSSPMILNRTENNPKMLRAEITKTKQKMLNGKMCGDKNKLKCGKLWEKYIFW